MPSSAISLSIVVDTPNSHQSPRSALASALSLLLAVVLEGTPLEGGRTITQHRVIPTLGIGAGMYTDGQVLDCNDALGMDPDFRAPFAKRYANLFAALSEAARAYLQDVKEGRFPAEEHSVRYLEHRGEGEEVPPGMQ